MTAVLSILTLAGAGAWLLARKARGSLTGPRPLRLLSRAGLTQKAGLALVEVGGRRLLVGYGDGPPTVLATLPPEAEAP